MCIVELAYLICMIRKLPLCAMLYYSQQVIEKYTQRTEEVVVVMSELQIARCRKASMK